MAFLNKLLGARAGWEYWVRDAPRPDGSSEFIVATRLLRVKGLPKDLTVCALVLLGACCSSVFPQVHPSRDPGGTPVLLITVDTVRADRLGCYGARNIQTPAMDGLAAQGVRFDRALAEIPTTPPSHAVILTGTYPMYNGVRYFTSSPLPKGIGVLAEAFQRQGYDTAAFVSSSVLGSNWGFNRGFQEYDDHFELRKGQAESRNHAAIERRAEDTVSRLLVWFQGRPTGGSGARPFFVWLHLYDPHAPYDPPAPFRARYADHLYDGEIAYADSQLARLFEYLRTNRLYDQALIALMSDHGESLGEHGEDEHGFFIYNSTLHVPLIFKLPSGMGRPHVVRRLVGIIDVAPTLLELLHLQDPLSRQFQGTSLAPDILDKGAAREHPVYAETYYPRDSFGWSELRGITTERFKYIQAPHPEFYDLGSDPQEAHNLYAERPSLAAALREQLTDLERRYASTRPTLTGPPLPPETVEKLKSLGYLAYSGAVQPAATGPLPDPKDHVKAFKVVLRAYALNEAGRYEESNRVLETLATEEPRLYVIPFLKAENLSQINRWQEAAECYQKALKMKPDLAPARLSLAFAYLNLGERDNAEREFRTFCQQSPSQCAHNIPELGTENKLIAFIEDTQRPVDDKTWFSLDRLTFETGKTTLSLNPRSNSTTLLKS